MDFILKGRGSRPTSMDENKKKTKMTLILSSLTFFVVGGGYYFVARLRKTLINTCNLFLFF